MKKFLLVLSMIFVFGIVVTSSSIFYSNSISNTIVIINKPNQIKKLQDNSPNEITGNLITETNTKSPSAN